jgi:cytidylate kinase
VRLLLCFALMLVTLSAAYGAGGSVIGPEVARRLGVPFCDRVIALTMAERLDVPVDEALAYEQPAEQGRLARLISAFAGGDPGATMALAAATPTPKDIHRAVTEALQAQAQTGRGVILGRGGGAELRDDPRVLRVRLSGPSRRRTHQATALGEVDEDRAERARRHFDQMHADYVRQFYGLDIDDPALYHLVIDSTALPTDLCVDLIERAARTMPDG